MTLHTSSVLADHVDVRNIWASWQSRLENALVCLVLAIHTGAVISLPQKLAGGEFPGLGFVWAFGGILCLVFAATDIKRTCIAALRAWPIVLFTTLAWASYSWTIDPYETMRGVLLLTTSQLFAFSLAARFTWERIMGLISWTLISLIGISVLLALAVPSVGRMAEVHVGAWSGAWPDKQLLGIYSCHGLIACLSLASMGRKHIFWLLGAALCLLAIIGSTGKTALLMAVIAIGAGIWLRISNRGVLGAVIAAWLVFIVGGISILAVSGGLDFIRNALGRSADFTGRTEVWDAVRKLGDMRPNTGWGFQSVWRGEMVITSPYQWVMDWTDFKPANAHSSWLDVYMQLGRPGFALLALIMGWVWFGILFRGANNVAATAFAGANLMAISFISFTETNLASAMDLQWFLVALIGTKLYYSYREAPKPAIARAKSGTLDGDTFTFDG
jgi:exopolysaccharide production protein ExoQ